MNFSPQSRIWWASRKIASSSHLRWVDLTFSSCCGEWWRVYPNIAREFCHSSSNLSTRLSPHFRTPHIHNKKSDWAPRLATLSAPFLSMEIAQVQAARCHAIIWWLFRRIFTIWPVFHPMTFRRANRICLSHSRLLEDVLQRFNSCNFRGILFWAHDCEHAFLTLSNFQGQNFVFPVVRFADCLRWLFSLINAACLECFAYAPWSGLAV
jgi:hypothetical protein